MRKITLLVSAFMLTVTTTFSQRFNQIVIFVELADTRIDYPLQHTVDVLNGSNGMKKSFSNYFDLASCGKVQYENYFPMKGDEIYVAKLPFTWKDVLASHLGGNDETNLCYNTSKIGKAAIENIVDKLPTDVNFDLNNDGMVDFITIFVAAKMVDATSTCPSHAGDVLPGTPNINGKAVGSVAYTTWTTNTWTDDEVGIIKEERVKYTFHVSLHETTHTFGIADYYYRYSAEHQRSSLGEWDIMCSGYGLVRYEYDGICNCWKPVYSPSLPSAYIRGKLNWVDIPEITADGRYTLYPATSGRTNDVAYKICTSADPEKKEYVVVEYRQKGDEDGFDGGIYGSGLVIYKVNTNFWGNAYAASTNYPDITEEKLIAETELMVYRCGGTPVSFGNIEKSFFSADVGRTAFSPDTDPYPFLASGEKITDIHIANISSAGETISFDFSRSPIISGLETYHSSSIIPISYYNLQGIRLSQPPKKGIYIVVYDNGKVEKKIK